MFRCLVSQLLGDSRNVSNDPHPNPTIAPNLGLGRINLNYSGVKRHYRRHRVAHDQVLLAA